MNAHAIESEIKRKMPEAEMVRVKLHGKDAVYCSASIDGRAHTIFVEPDIAQFYGGWNEKTIAVYVVAKLAEALV